MFLSLLIFFFPVFMLPLYVRGLHAAVVLLHACRSTLEVCV
jgi:hypothetical protein